MPTARVAARGKLNPSLWKRPRRGGGRVCKGQGRRAKRAAAHHRLMEEQPWTHRAHVPACGAVPIHEKVLFVASSGLQTRETGLPILISLAVRTTADQKSNRAQSVGALRPFISCPRDLDVLQPICTDFPLDRIKEPIGLQLHNTAVMIHFSLGRILVKVDSRRSL